MWKPSNLPDCAGRRRRRAKHTTKVLYEYANIPTRVSKKERKTERKIDRKRVGGGWWCCIPLAGQKAKELTRLKSLTSTRSYTNMREKTKKMY